MRSGGTTVQLNKDEMFFLQVSDIEKDEARRISLNAFAGDVIDSIKTDE